MNEYTVNVGYRKYDKKFDSLRLYSQTMKIMAEDKETAKLIAWKAILDEYPDSYFNDANVRLSHRK